MRALWAILAGLLLLFPVLSAAPVGADDASAREAAEEIADARERANAAADAMFEAESELDSLQVDQDRLRSEIASLEAEIADLQSTVEAVAINRFTRSGTNALPLLSGYRTAGEQAQIDVLIDVINDTSADDFDEFDLLSSQLIDKQTELEASEQTTEAARDEFDRRRDEALEEVELLKDVEKDRLQDEAVRKALQAEEAERRRQADVLKQQDAAAQRAANTAGVVDDDIDAPAAPGAATGGASGGQTGQSGIGSRPGASPGDLGSASWVCPVIGSVSFGDTWGAPRSGGRSHQGVDMIGNRGLALVAVVGGVATTKVNTLGGKTVSLAGADGNRYYYAHLDNWATIGPVEAGTVIGYIGDTGNAQYSTPHLHFEIHPAGGAAVNPFPTVRAHC